MAATSDSSDLLIERRGRVGILTFNRPEELNTLHMPMLEQLRETITDWNSDPTIGAIVLTGKGRAFCAGANLRGRDTSARPAADGEASGQRDWWKSLIRLILDSKPIICAINGYAIGGGLTFVLPADVRIASENARLSMRFARLGAAPELWSSFLLPRIVGLGHALELIESGRIIDAREAHRIGLVNHVVPPDELLDRAIGLAAEIASNDAEAVRQAKSLVWRHLNDGDLDSVMDDEFAVIGKLMEGPGFKEAMAAFVEKREPQFNRTGE